VQDIQNRDEILAVFSNASVLGTVCRQKEVLHAYEKIGDKLLCFAHYLIALPYAYRFHFHHHFENMQECYSGILGDMMLHFWHHL